MDVDNKTTPLTDEDITDGIEIKDWKIDDYQDETITFSTWDFAGQTVYYNTHQVTIMIM